MERKRERTLQKKIYITPEEQGMIADNMRRCGTNNFSVYARKMLIDGYLIKLDFTDMKALVTELGAIGRNINQIAKIANSTKSIHEADIQALRTEFFKMRGRINERLVKIINEDY